MLTQLATTASGAVIGLRYESMPFVLRAMGVARSEWATTLDAVQVMERHLVHLLASRR